MFNALIHRRLDSGEWRKIPWNDAEFSRRMLREHLTQEHDAASRPFPIIDQQVAWIHRTVLGGRQSSILDLGCGPGFYVHRFARLGHACKGIDFGPASIDYARQHHAGVFVLGDVLAEEYGTECDLICMIYGELNAFAPESAERIVEKAYQALKPGGNLLLEVSHYDAIREVGQQPPSWYTAEGGLFSDKPYIVLQESGFENNRSSSWHHVIDAESGALAQYVAMHQAYTEAEYRHLLRRFEQVTFYPSLTGEAVEGAGMFVIVAQK